MWLKACGLGWPRPDRRSGASDQFRRESSNFGWRLSRGAIVLVARRLLVTAFEAEADQAGGRLEWNHRLLSAFRADLRVRLGEEVVDGSMRGRILHHAL
jgi:hypothetical protein